MGELDKQGVVTMQELIASSLAQADALTKLLIEKRLITKDEFMQKLSAERAVYQAMLGKIRLNKVLNQAGETAVLLGRDSWIRKHFL